MPRVAPSPGSLPPRSGYDSLLSHFGLLLASAILLGLAYPRPGWSIFVYVALVPMTVLALRTNRPWRLLWTGYLVAWAWWLVMSRWLIGVTGGGYAALAAYMAIYIPLTLLTVRWLHRRYRSATVLTLPIVWVSYEFIRCNYPQGGFAWFALGHALAPSAPGDGVSRLIQIADLFGQHGVSFLVAMTNGLIVDLFTRPLMRRDSSRSRPRRTITAAVVLWAAAMAGAWTYGYFRAMPSATPPSGLLRVTVIQTNVPQNNKDHPTPDQMDADWRRMIQLTLDAGRAEPNTQLYVWPETMVPAALNREALKRDEIAENFHEQIGALAQRLGAYLLVGSETALQWSTHTINGGTYELPNLRWNSTYLYRPDGTQATEHYDKIRRVPFGEYLPWIDDMPALKGLFQKYLSPYGDYDYTIQAGTRYTLFDIGSERGSEPGRPGPGTPPSSTTMPASPTDSASSADAGAGTARLASFHIATPICFEDAIPWVDRRMVYDDQGDKRADMLVNVTNDGWYPATDQAVQQLQIAVLRCVENRVPMARSVNTGISGFIDSNGQIGPVVEVDGKSQEVEGWASAVMRADPRKTLFGRIGSAPIVGLIILTGALCLGGFVRKEKG